MSTPASPPPASTAPPSARGAALWLVPLALVGGWLGARAGFGFMGVETVLAVVLGLMILAPLVSRMAAGTFDMFEPAVVIAGVYFMYFVVGPLVRFLMDDMVFVGRDLQDVYLRALLAVMLAVVSLWAGYAVPVGPRPGSARVVPWDARTARRLGWGLVAGGLIGMVLWARVAGRSLGYFFLPGLIGSAGPGGGTEVAYFFLAIEFFIPALLILIMSGGLRSTRGRVGLVVLITVVYASIGFRYRVLVMWIAVAMLLYLLKRTRPRFATLAWSGSAAFLLMGWLAWARTFFRSGGAAGQLNIDFGSVLKGALSDTRIFDTFGAVLYAVPTFVPHAGFDPYAYVFVLPIPRALFPDKPYPHWLAEIGGSLGTFEAANLGAAVPHFGEYYISFGWPGMAVGMFLFGMGARWLWSWFRAAPDDPWRQLIFALHSGFLFQVIIRGYMAQIVQEWCFIILPALGAMWMSRRRARLDAEAAAVA